MKKKVKRLLITLFVLTIVVLASISFVRYFYLLSQNYNLNTKLLDVEKRIKDLNKVKQELQLSLEKENKEYKEVLNDKESLKGQLEELQGKLLERELDLEDTRIKLSKVRGEIEGLNKDQVVLRDQIGDLEIQIEQLTNERDVFEAKFNSLPELKKAIKLLRSKFYVKRIEMQEALDAKELKDGNQGFLIWQGKSTIKEKVKIEVLPFEP